MQYFAKDMFLDLYKNKQKMQGKFKTLSSAKTRIEKKKKKNISHICLLHFNCCALSPQLSVIIKILLVLEW